MTQVIAHRGASRAAPENTIEAYLLARRLGADWVELDARRTADRAVVVHHNAHLADGRVIAGLPAAELPPSLPTLRAALDACAGMGVNIEIKNLPGEPDFEPSEQVAADVVSEVQRRGAHARVLVSSFHLPTVDRVLELDADVPTAWLVFDADEPVTLAARARRHGHRALHPWDGLVTPELMAAAQDNELQVNVWTVDDPDRMAALIGLGVDGIVTNVPDVARAVVDG